MPRKNSAAAVITMHAREELNNHTFLSNKMKWCLRSSVLMDAMDNTGGSGDSPPETVTIDHASLKTLIESAVWRALLSDNWDSDDHTSSGKLF